MAQTLGNAPKATDVNRALVQAAQNLINAYVQNEIILGDLQYCLGSDALITAAGIDMVANPEDATLIRNVIAAHAQMKASFEGTIATGAINIVQLCALLKGL